MTDNGIDLRPDDLALLLKAVRKVPDRDRDQLFKMVADRLRPIREITTADVNHAIGSSLTKLGVLT